MKAYWPCHLSVELDKGRQGKPLPLVKDGDLVALVRYMIRTRGLETVRVTKVKGMLRMWMFNKDGLGWRINWVTLMLMLLLTWVVVISLKCLLMLGVGCSKLVVIGTFLCMSCIGLWLLLLG